MLESVPVLEEVRGRPFLRPGLSRRIAPFAVVAALGELSLALPPGPVSMADTYWSIALLVLTAALVLLAPWETLPRGTTVVVPLVYVASLAFLGLAAGGTTSGIGVLVLIPLVWAALYHSRWQAVVVVAAVVGYQIVLALVPIAEPASATARRVLFWAVLGIAVALTISDLRTRLWRAFSEREALHLESAENLRRTLALAAAAEELTSELDPRVVITSAARLAAELVSPYEHVARRAQYVRVRGATAEVTTVFDEGRSPVAASFPLSEHPLLREVVESGEALDGSLEASELGPTVRALVSELDLVSGVYVPVMVGGRLDGVLVVSLRAGAATESLFQQCKALGHLTELALGNALAHERMQELATTDPLTGVANRHSFEQLMKHLPGRGPYSVLVMDVDGLKDVNDGEGHAAGDALLKNIAAAVSAVMRRGDVLARLGGDEFAMVCFEADEHAAELVARRILDSLREASREGHDLRISIGAASGISREAWQSVLEAADSAMYRAKAAGGARYACSH